MPLEFVRCVRALQKKGKDKDSAYAICTAEYEKNHGVTPQQAAGEAYLQELMDTMPEVEKPTESETPMVTEKIREVAVISEAAFDEAAKTIDLDIIRSGRTKNGKREYTREALEKGTAKYVGAQMFLDHSTETEDRERPARSVRDLAAVIESAWFENDAIRGRARVLDPDWFPKLKECWAHIGISADQIVRGRKAEAGDTERLIVESIEAVRCVDFVTRANAGGAVNRIIESYEKGSESDVELKDITIAQLREARPDLVTELTKVPETATPSLSEAKVADMIREAVAAAKPEPEAEGSKQLAREVMILRTQPKVGRIVKEAKLHPAVEQKVREALADYAEDDAAELQKHVENVITIEREYAAKLTEGITGLGGQPDTDEEPEETRKAREALVDKGRDRFTQG